MTKHAFWVRSASAKRPTSIAPGWAVQPLVRQYPGCMGVLSAYGSVLDSGHMPHDIHAHDEEEIIVLLSGGLELLTPESTVRIGPGSFVYHPPGHRHSVRSVGPEPAEYLVFKWIVQNTAGSCPEPEALLFDAGRLKPWSERPGRYRQRVCEGLPLAGGGCLTADVVRVTPHVGCPAHTHDHDVVLVMLRGEMHALGRIMPAPCIIYYAAGLRHDVEPTSPESFDAVVFEFHPPPATSPASV